MCSSILSHNKWTVNLVSHNHFNSRLMTQTFWTGSFIWKFLCKQIHSQNLFDTRSKSCSICYFCTIILAYSKFNGKKVNTYSFFYFFIRCSKWNQSNFLRKFLNLKKQVLKYPYQQESERTLLNLRCTECI